MRVGLLHLGQSVLLVVSITFLRSAVLAILAIEGYLLEYLSERAHSLGGARRPDFEIFHLDLSPMPAGMDRDDREELRTRSIQFTSICKPESWPESVTDLHQALDNFTMSFTSRICFG
jgi:hypothetical protein